MADWLTNALAYIPLWVGYQQRQNDLPGVSVAIGKGDKVLAAFAFGMADLASETKMLPTHRFRVASHSKTFTATAIMLLVEAGRIKLDDRVGDYVPRLHKDVAAATIRQLLSHSAGIIRDGLDTGQWAQRRPFLNEAELRAELAQPPVIPANTRMKYSNHGFGLLGLVIEAVTGERYNDWIAREIVAASGLTETLADAPLRRGMLLARGHSAKLPMGRRVVIPGENPTHALAAATGFISTASDLARFFASLSPTAKKSALTVASRREMSRRLWRDPHASLERWYGLGTIAGTLGDWEWFGHSGGFQGSVTRTAVVPEQGLCVSVLTNASDGLSQVWLDGALHILRAYARHGAPSRSTARWSGRWWSLFNCSDLLPMGHKVLVANPALPNPLLDASELEVSERARDRSLHGRIALAGGFANHGEPVRLVRNGRGKATQLWLSGAQLFPEARVVKELVGKYD